MKERSSFVADMIRFAIAAVFVIMTSAFLTVPYAMSAHPGDPAPVASAAARHLS